ncbi:MAG: serine hydrolase [Acidobacteriota bacterium]|nr:MAG: serine hydrolase [Acidobacteriota bacterium]
MKKAVLILPAFLFFLVLTLGQTQSVQEPSEVTEPVGPYNPAEVEAFVDGLMSAQFQAYSLAGAVVTIVRDGEVLLSKGYGFSDVENRKPVDPGRTLFRIGSVSKLFTWTALMQLIQEGKVQLDADVNQYLDQFQIPADFESPITIKNLMTHTPGLEDRYIRLFARTPDALQPLSEVLRGDFPARVREPGTIPAYSNHGTALAGLIVANVSGLSWEDYVQERILDPLQIFNSTVRQPVPDALLPDLSKGYRWDGSRLAEEGFEFVPARPAGSVSACGDDMARFMLAFLAPNRSEGGQILSDESIRLMQEQLFTPDPRIAGLGRGFILNDFNGERVVGHGGDTFFFHSNLSLLPAHELGLFVSYNSEDGGRARTEFLEAFFERYFPAIDQPMAAPRAGFEERVAEIAGSYRSSRRPQTTIDKIAELMGSFDVWSDLPGELVTSGAGPRNTRWVEIEPFLFVEKGGWDRLVFRVDESSGRMLAFLGSLPVFGFEMLSWYESPRFHLTVLAICWLMLLSTLVFPVLAFFFERKQESLLARRSVRHTKARWLAVVVTLLFTVFLVGLVVSLRNPLEIVYDIPSSLAFLLVLPVIGAVLTLVLTVVAIVAWKGQYWSILARLHYSLVAVAAIVLVWQLNYWNLLGWKY